MEAKIPACSSRRVALLNQDTTRQRNSICLYSCMRVKVWSQKTRVWLQGLPLRPWPQLLLPSQILSWILRLNLPRSPPHQRRAVLSAERSEAQISPQIPLAATTTTPHDTTRALHYPFPKARPSTRKSRATAFFRPPPTNVNSVQR
jgi:hypothetical protein